MFAEKQGGRTVSARVMRGHDATTRSVVRRDELRDRVGGKRGLITERDHDPVERTGELADRRHTGADRGRHALGPRGAVRDEHGQVREDGADFLRVGAEHDDDRPSGRREGGVDGADDERLAIEREELFRSPHARRLTGGEDHRGETKGDELPSRGSAHGVNPSHRRLSRNT